MKFNTGNHRIALMMRRPRWLCAGGNLSMIQKRMRTLLRPFLLAVPIICAVTPLPLRAETGVTLERLNRNVFEMNQIIMHNLVQPAMAAYQSQVPVPVRQTILAVYDNLLEPVTASAYILVGEKKPGKSITDSSTSVRP
jgi:hypothetical protein